MSLSKTLRFEIFKRDQFTCRYCGNTPPAAILEIDHVIPLSGGGDDQKENLITACFDCNRGKGARSLEQVIRPLTDTAQEIEQREEQLKAYRQLLRTKKRREDAEIDEVEKAFQEVYTERNFTPSFRTSIKRHFLSKLPLEYVVEAMETACAKGFDANHATKYFCGIAWRMVRDQEGRGHAN